MNKRSCVSVFTDGSCNSNSGQGGYAAIILKGGFRKEIVGNIPNATINRMELLAVVKGLSAVKPGSIVKVFTDSAYVERAVNEGRLAIWQNNGWLRIRTMEPVKNADLWRYYLSVVDRRRLIVKFLKISAHKGNRINERVDFLARQAANAS